MIVNPQLFNYRLIIGSLVIAIVILGSFSYTSYNILKENQVFIEQEKILVESELSEMISSYDAVDVKSAFIAKQLEETKSKISRILDSVKLIKPNASLISKYRAQIKVLKQENVQILALADNLAAENTSLKQQTKEITSHLVETKTIANTLKTKNETLAETNLHLKEDLEKAKQLIVTNIVAKGVKRVTSSNRIVNTRNVNKTNKFQVCFTLAKNELLQKGRKELYIQVLDSKMNVVADKGTLNFGKTSLIYSAIETVDYNNEDMDICSLIDKGTEKLTKGAYFISVFYQGKKLGRTTIELE
ncbi:hypothetical protein [Lacinutrix sp. Bg11-31]|uniref:hypothetical protein n=1 Tax=Lacinutrix sp. Bg11-31 TaxID=2057808 RepID=UPI000C31974F|nr:hypothetical protein [Lacinutrix sp. Bg11-31]AUC82742.1 hypothetical protein CW733_11655 [Lacinutrix sp. Bg11-31]